MLKPNLNDIKKLREKTGAGMMTAKKALEQSNNNFEKAIEILRLSGEITATKKAQRDTSNGLIEVYVHSNRVGALLEINCETDFVAKTDEFKKLAKDIAMQIVAFAPLYIDVQDIPKDVVEKERKLYQAEVKNNNKPKNVIEKIVKGKLEKYFDAVCLMRQTYLRDQNKTVNKLIVEFIAKLGENIKIKRFVRFELGEKDND